MRKDISLPALAVLGGLAGFGLRWWQLSSAFQPDLGLFAHGAPATYALAALAAVLAAVLLVGILPLRQGPEDFLPAFRCPQAGQMTVLAAAGLLFLAAAALGLRDGLHQLQQWRLSMSPDLYLLPHPFSTLLCAGLCLPAGLGVLAMGKAAYRDSLSAGTSVLAPFPACAGLVWLFVTHLSHGTEPVLLRYLPQLAAAGLLMLALYYCAGFFFGRPCRRRALFCCLSGAAAGLTSLADRPELSTCVLTLAFVLTALGMARALLRNCLGPAWPEHERMPCGAGDDEE